MKVVSFLLTRPVNEDLGEEINCTSELGVSNLSSSMTVSF